MWTLDGVIMVSLLTHLLVCIRLFWKGGTIFMISRRLFWCF